MSGIHEQHDKAFGNVSAFVIAKDGKRLATIAFKFGNAVTAYVHWLGEEMARGRANGGGYDRKSAACADYVRRSPERSPSKTCEHFARMERLAEMGDQSAGAELKQLREHNAARGAFRDALRSDGGDTWCDRLRNAGFDVWQAV